MKIMKIKEYVVNDPVPNRNEMVKIINALINAHKDLSDRIMNDFISGGPISASGRRLRVMTVKKMNDAISHYEEELKILTDDTHIIEKSDGEWRSYFNHVIDLATLAPNVFREIAVTFD